VKRGARERGGGGERRQRGKAEGRRDVVKRGTVPKGRLSAPRWEWGKGLGSQKTRGKKGGEGAEGRG